jgi:hypothetical protein
MKIETKYSIGDLVYRPYVDVGRVREVCPDCVGQCTWFVVLPCGEELFIKCPTCKHGYDGSLGWIEEYAATGRVQYLFVRSVDFDSSRDGANQEYKCYEAGEDGCWTCSEGELFSNPAEAEALLPALVEERQRDFEEQRARSLACKKKDRVGSMASHFRRQIRAAQKDIEVAERGLAREGNG